MYGAALRIVGAVLVVVAIVGPGKASRAEEPETGMRPIGKLERIPADVRAALGDEIVPTNFVEGGAADGRDTTQGTIILLSEARQLWQLYRLGDGFGTGIAVRDLDSLKLLTTFRIDSNPRRAGVSNGEWMYAIDGARRLFLAVDTADGLSFLEIDVKTFALTNHPLEPVAAMRGFQLSGGVLAGMTYDARQDRLLALFGTSNANSIVNIATYVYELKLASSQGSLRQFRSCGGPLPPTDSTVSGHYAVRILMQGESAYVFCHRTGYIGAVVRVPLVGLLDPGSDEQVAIGPGNVRNALVDPGSGRIFVITTNGEIWVFEAATMSFIGVVPTKADRSAQLDIGYGLDDQTGRLFYLSPSFGLGLVEGRFFPVPQARTLPQKAADGSERIWSDARTGRFFVLPGTGSAGRPWEYTIYDAGPAPVPPPPPDPDRNTVDRPEKQGETESRFFASGSGYGVRALIANGLNTVAPAPYVGIFSPTAFAITSAGGPNCGFTDRELVAGRVAKAEYDTGSTAASAIAVDIDERTKLDLDKPSRCDIRVKPIEAFRGLFATSPEQTEPFRATVENDDADNPRWGRKPATCSSSEGEPSGTTGNGDDAGQQSLGSSSVACPLPGGDLTAHAVSRLVGEVAVGHAETNIDIKREKGGVRTVAESWARDIELAVSNQTNVKIGEVWARATSFSNGRPSKGAQSTHEFKIKRVSIGTVELCAENCDPHTVVARLNQILIGTVEFRIANGIDNPLLLGSPKGASTAVQKSVQRQTSDRALTGDFTTEVPALDMVVYNDNGQWGRARQVYQFAGVSSAATYNISLLPREVAFGDDPTTPEDESSDRFGADAAAGAIGGATGISATGGSGEAGFINAVKRALGALARGIRVFFTNPRQSLLLLTGWGLFFLPGVLARRRLRLLQHL